jgi:hypothetical protein
LELNRIYWGDLMLEIKAGKYIYVFDLDPEKVTPQQKHELENYLRVTRELIEKYAPEKKAG